MLATYNTQTNANYLRPFTLSNTQGSGNQRKREDKVQIQALLDSGAVSSRYISIAFAIRLDKLGYTSILLRKRVCTGLLNSKCTDTTHSYKLEFYFRNELTKQEEIIAIVAQVIDSRFDLIIGLPDLAAFDLCRKSPSLFSPARTIPHRNVENTADTDTISKACGGTGCSECTHLCSVTNPETYEPLRQREVVSKEALLDPIPSDWDEIEWDCPGMK